MSNFIANARIVIQADTTPFSAALKKVVTQTERTKLRIKLIPDPVGFIRDATTQIKSIEKKLPPVRVKVVPDLRGFRTAVRSAALEATKDLSIPVALGAGRVEGARGAVGAAGGGGGVASGGVIDKRVAQAQLEVARATDAGVAARRRFDKSLSESERQMLRDVRIADQLSTSTKAVSAAAQSGVPALQAQAEALRVAAVRAEEANKARKLRAAQPTKAQQAEAAAAEKLAAAKAAEEAATQRLLGAERQREAFAAQAQTQRTNAFIANEAARKRELVDLLKIDKIETEKLAKRAAAAIDESRRQSQIDRSTRTRGLTIIGERAIQQNEALALSEEAAARAKTQFAAATRHSAVAAIAEADPVKKLASAKAAERAATAGLVEAKAAEEAARFAATGAMSKELTRVAALRAEELRLAEARLADAAAATAQAKSQLVSAGRFGAARRAIEATAAQLVGLRGAALSAQGAFIATAAGAIALTKAVQSAAELESTLNVFKATADATASQMERVSATARDLGRDISLPGVSAQDAADALTLLSKAGLTVEDSIDGARGVLQLATAAAIDNAQATELTASALNAFGLAGNQAVRVADVLANSANASQGSIVDMGVALQQASAVARQAGLSLEQTAAVLTLYARAGLRGSDAGTSLRTALIRLINPTTKAQKEIDKLGLHLRTASGAINLDVFDEFAQKTRNLTSAQRDQALAIIFGQDAIRGAAILAREGSAGLNAQIAGLRKQGTAAELANARMAGLAGSLENLKNQISSAGIAIGQVFIPPLKVMIDSMAATIQIAAKFTDQLVAIESAAINAAKSLGSFAEETAKRGVDIVPDIKIGPIDTKKQGKDIEKGLKTAAKLAGRAVLLGPFAAPLNAKDAAAFALGLDKASTNASDVGREVRQILLGLRNSKEEVDGIAFTSVVGQLTALQEKLAGGDKEAQRLSGEISDIIAHLKEGTALPPFKFPKVELPPDLRAGRPGKEAGDAIFQAFDAALPGEKLFNIGFNAMGNFAQGIHDGALAAADAITTAIPLALAAAEAAITEGLKKLTKRQDIRAGALEEKALDIKIAGGGDLAVLKNLRAQAKVQADKIIALQGQAGKEAVDARRAAKEKQAQILEEIRSIEESRKTDAEQATQKAKQARDEADQAFLDSLVPEQMRLDRAAIRATATEGLKDDTAVMVARRKRLHEEIALIEDNVKDTKNASAEIERRRTEIQQLTIDIGKNERLIAEAEFERKQARFERRQTAAEAIGDIRGAINAITRRINGYNELIRAYRGEKAGLQKLLDARDDLKRDREKLRSDQLQQNVDFARSIFELTGNKNPLLRAINAEIMSVKRQIDAAKRAGKSTIALRTELNNWLIERKSVLEDAKDEAEKGTTVFELLQQNAQTFTATAGNLITGNQPFAGPAGFTTDITQFLTRQRQGTINLRVPTQRDRVENELIAAIRENTEAIKASNGTGNRSTATTTIEPGVGVGSLRDRFLDATRARKVRESRSGY